ncbi:MAG: ion transporter [Verrucomicrobia bacterium]|jgi:voltage-gated potassium channel|nr:ion transporter [Verrucomicrobiota bacterium]
MNDETGSDRIKARLNTIIFGAETPLGRAYDIALLGVIGMSVFMVMLDSVASLHASYGRFFYAFEWGFTVFFTLEYLVRLWCGDKALRYAFSFFGIVDFLGVIPTYLGLLFHGSHYLVAIRFLRVLRVFRVMKLSSYEGELRAMSLALKASRRRILVFLFFVMTMVVVLGSLMYVVEGEANGFTSIPTSIYWAIVTLTTVGYGDISPGTPLGQAVAALLMILGYSIIVVPTGIVSVEAARSGQAAPERQCPSCRTAGHDVDATHCKFCGVLLEER